MMSMEWKKLIVYVYSEAMDPGIVHQDCTKTELLPEELKVGERIGYDDPSRIMASLTVKDMDENGVTLLVGGAGKEVRLWPGEVQEVDKDGRDYTNFYLHVTLEPSCDKET